MGSQVVAWFLSTLGVNFVAGLALVIQALVGVFASAFRQGCEWSKPLQVDKTNHALRGQVSTETHKF